MKATFVPFSVLQTIDGRNWKRFPEGARWKGSIKEQVFCYSPGKQKLGILHRLGKVDILR
jgi:hypothetical protein